MPTFRYAKLVRDNIRKMHEDNGDIVAGKNLTKKELTAALVAKLSEETEELASAIRSSKAFDIQSELADIYQVIEDLAKTLHISEAAIIEAKEKKFRKKGGFSKGMYIDTVTLVHEDDPLIPGFRADPDKYPELPNH